MQAGHADVGQAGDQRARDRRGGGVETAHLPGEGDRPSGDGHVAGPDREHGVLRMATGTCSTSRPGAVRWMVTAFGPFASPGNTCAGMPTRTT